MKEINNTQEYEHYKNLALKEEKVLIVKFYAPWCGPCRQLDPMMDTLEQITPPDDVIFVKVNIDTNSKISNDEKVRGVPTTICFLARQERWRVSGANISAIEVNLNKLLTHFSVKEMKEALKKDSNVKACIEELLKITENLCRDQFDSKLRDLPLSSGLFEKYFFITPGAMDFLYALGYIENGTMYTLKFNANFNEIKFLSEQLDNLINAPKPVVVKAKDIQQLTSLINCMRYYNIPSNIEEAKRIVPYEEIRNRAKDNADKNESNLHVEFLKELMRWFKNDFFTWFNPPKCSVCQLEMKITASRFPSEEEKRFAANTTEVYACPSNCSHSTFRFPRYSDPKKLLQTKTGRCGEWANCFTLLLQASERFKAVRYIYDFTDHVFCEVWIEGDGYDRWIHCDPCEAICDKPLLYEVGWGKSLSYIFAFTITPWKIIQNEVYSNKCVLIQDVSFRYSKDFKKLLQRRNQYKELALTKYLVETNINSLQHLKEVFRKNNHFSHPFTPEAIMKELFELSIEDKGKVGQLQGRTSGPKEWREARGELGTKQFNTIELLEDEIKNLEFYLRYNSSKDEYQRVISRKGDLGPDKPATYRSNDIVESGNTIKIGGWKSLVYQWENIERKVEEDWKMSYLCRTEGSLSSIVGKISWLIKVPKDYTIDKVTLILNVIKFDDNQIIDAIMCAGKDQVDELCHKIDTNSPFSLNMDHFTGMNALKLEILLKSIKTSNDLDTMDWQKAQLFRQSLNDPSSCSFEFKITLKKA